jgi:hypothetical protein
VKQGSGQPNLNTDIVKALRFGFPPEQEQSDIVVNIKSVSAQFDALTAAVERALALLQERRTALISAAVTGRSTCGTPLKKWRSGGKPLSKRRSERATTYQVEPPRSLHAWSAAF